VKTGALAFGEIVEPVLTQQLIRAPIKGWLAAVGMVSVWENRRWKLT